MIPSIDTYVYKKVKDTLNAILKQEQIVSTTLANIDDRAREQFMKAYCGVNAKREVEVSYVFPQAKETFDARIVIQLGEANEESTSLGNVEGTFTTRETGDKEEDVVLQVDGDRMFFETSHTIGYYSGSDNLSFSEQDQVEIDDNRLYFRKSGNEPFIGLEMRVFYTSKEKLAKDPKGVQKGYTSRDIVEVTPLSTNIDTARCLDAIMKVILIIMREDFEEKTTYNLQSADFSPMQNIVSENELDRIVFGRPLTLSYTVSYSVDFDFTKEIKEIILKGVTKGGTK